MDTTDSETKFLARLAQLGATPAYDRYRGANKPHRVICTAGHEVLSPPRRRAPREGSLRNLRQARIPLPPKRPSGHGSKNWAPRSSSRNGAESTIRTW